jgi:two-component system response regulator YesN
MCEAQQTAGMFRIVIADDEEVMRNILAKKIAGSGGPWSVAGTAGNGKQALEMIKQYGPDILITDICMPLMDGLELAGEAVKLNRDIKIVIISGYDDFAYAKKAITLGISDYLLKPFLPDELFSVLKKITGEIEDKTKQYANMMEKQRYFEDNLSWARELFLTKLVKGPGAIPAEKNSEIADSPGTVGIDLSGTCFAAGILCFISGDGVPPEDDSLSGKAWDYISSPKGEFFPPDLKCYFFHSGDKLPSVLFTGSRSAPGIFKTGIEEGILKMNLSVKKYFGLRCFCILGSVSCQKEGIGRSYREGFRLWQSTLDTGREVIFYEALPGKKTPEDPCPRRLREPEGQLLTRVEMGDLPGALGLLEDLLRYYAEMSLLGYDNYVFLMLAELALNISAIREKYSGDPLKEENREALARLKKHFSGGSLMDVRGTMRDYIRSCCAELSASGKNRGERIVIAVKELIESHLGDAEFNLERAAAMVYFSPSYVRQIFRHFTGTGFMEYLIRRRMETAGRLLANSGYKIQEVAEQAGYSNQRYFSSCFKKHYRCTPSDYRKSHTAGE